MSIKPLTVLDFRFRIQSVSVVELLLEQYLSPKLSRRPTLLRRSYALKVSGEKITTSCTCLLWNEKCLECRYLQFQGITKCSNDTNVWWQCSPDPLFHTSIACKGMPNHHICMCVLFDAPSRVVRDADDDPGNMRQLLDAQNASNRTFLV